jgi:hypothetical protein
MSTFVLVLSFLATWRLARLITTDTIADPLRRWAAGAAPDGEPGDGDDLRPWLGYLFTCPWCISVWVAPLLVVPAVWWPENRAVVAVLGVLVASGVAGLLAVIEGAMGRED